MAEKVPLAEMVDAIDHEAFMWRVRIDIYNREHPDEPLSPTHHWVKQGLAFKAAGDVLRVMASYEDKSRAFVAQLMKDYAEGRWP